MSLSPLIGSIWAMAVTTVAIALIAAAIVQLIKDLLPVRRWFQRSYLKKWLNKRIAERQPRPDLELNFDVAERDLIHLATGGDRKAFYDLETAQLCGQMNSAAQIAIAYPSRH